MNITKLSLALALVSACFLQADESKIKLPRILDMPEAIVPLSLQSHRFNSPKAEVKVSISKEGVPLEAVCISADHYLLAEAGEKVVMDTEFSVGKSDGVPIQSLTALTIPFIYQSQYLTSKSGFDHMKDFMGAEKPKDEDKVVHCKAQELDEPLRIVTPPKLIMIKDENGVPQTGSATIEGIVDTEGRFRLLSVIKSDNDYVAIAAIDSFKEIIFNKPTKDGARATTRIRLPYKGTAQTESE